MTVTYRSPAGRRASALVCLLLIVLAKSSRLPAQAGVGDFTFTTIAGVASSAGSTNGPRLDARFNRPEGVAVAPNGDVWVADTSNHIIRRISTTGEVTTVAGVAGQSGTADGQGSQARFLLPASIVVGQDGAAYVAEHFGSAIRRVADDGTVSTFSGSKTASGHVDGPAGTARFGSIRGLTLDDTGAIFAADSFNSAVRRVAPDGSVTTFATGVPESTALALHPNGSIYVTCGLLIRRVSSGGVVSVLAGGTSSGYADGPGPLARFNDTRGIVVAQDGTLVVSDASNNRLRRVTTSGDTTTIAGTGLAAGGDGVGQYASLRQPSEIATRADGVLVFADTLNHAIRTFDAGLVVSTFAGSLQTPGHGDGPGARAIFDRPRGLTLDPDGVMHVVDSRTHTVRSIAADGTVSTLAGRPWMAGSDNGPGIDARFFEPSDVAWGPGGDVFVADSGNHTIRRIDSTGYVSLVAGQAGVASHTNGPAAVARFRKPSGIVVDSAGNLYVADRDNNAIRLITSAGVVSTLAGGSSGSADGTGTAARFSSPRDLTIGPDGVLWVVDGNGLRRVTTAGVVTTLVTSSAVCSTSFCNFTDLTVDDTGVIYVTATDNAVRQIHPTGGAMVIGGTSGSSGATDGSGAAARFLTPSGIARATDGSLRIADFDSGRIVRGTPPAPQAPIITQHPASGTSNGVFSLTFQVTAKAYPAATFQWQMSPNGAAWTNVTESATFRGAFQSLLQVTNAPATLDRYLFRCVVTNAIGSASSNPATLRVVVAPTISRTSLSFAAVKNGASGSLVSVTPGQRVDVTFEGGVPSVWHTDVNVSWLQVVDSSWTGNGYFTASIVNPSNVIGGATTLTTTIRVHPSYGPPNEILIPITLTIDQTGAASSPPFGQIDTPSQGATNIQGAIGLTGWALDDLGVASVKAYRPCLPFDNPASCQDVDGYNVVYLADGVFLPGARPDLETAFPTTPLNYRGGWGVQILSPMLPHLPNGQLFGGQGTMPIFVFATDHDGKRTLLGRSQADHTPTFVTMDNDAIAKPFGTIDTPALGQTVSGTLANFGWALTPDSNTVADGTDIAIPTPGSSMYVFIDGVAIGSVTYNQCRGSAGSPVPGGVFCDDDVANIFGNITPMGALTPRFSNPTRFRNLDAARGPQASFVIDTRALSNGLHTIAWSVTDSANRVEGIGSRFFSVLNGSSISAVAGVEDGNGDNGQLAAVPGREAALISDVRPRTLGASGSIADRSVRRSGVAGRTGFDVDAPSQVLAPDRSGTRTVRLDHQDRLELALGPNVTAGYLVVGEELRELPIGSRLDPASGTFTWAPPVGYFGTYQLTFLTGDDRVVVDVIVGPRTESIPGTSEIRMHVDTPIDGATVSGPVTLNGWALDPGASLGSGIGAVHIWAARRGFNDPVFLGEATLGVERPDVETAFGRGFGASGFSLTTTLRPGTYDVTIYAWSARTRRWEDARVVHITVR